MKLRLSILSILLTAMTVVFVSSAMAAGAWDPTSSTSENVTVYDAQFNIIASYAKENWTTAVSSDGVITRQIWSGSPPVLQESLSDDRVDLQNGRIAVANQLSGSSKPDSSSYHPSISWYSFDAPLFDAPGDAKPGVIVSPSTGSYNGTVGVTLRAYAPDPDPLEILRILTLERELPLDSGQWQELGGSEVQLFFTKTTTLRVRAKLLIQKDEATYTTTSAVREYTYDITQPSDWNRDSDNDGYPDIWEIAHGFNPLAAESPAYDTDSDEDGYTDLYESLRGSDPFDENDLPDMADDDDDGFSNWEEDLRDTNKDEPEDHPVNTRLYEVEVTLQGTVRNNTNPVGGGFIKVHTLAGEIVAGIAQVKVTADGSYGPLRIPVGTYTVINAGVDEEYTKNCKRFIASRPDLTPLMMTDTNWQTAGEWQALYEQFLRENLVIQVTDFDLTPADNAPLALLSRAMEIYHNGLAAPGTEEIWYSPGRFGHNPDPVSVRDFDAALSAVPDPSWITFTTTEPRNINSLMEDFTEVLTQKNCQDIVGELQALYDSSTADTLDADIAVSMQKPGPSYLASLLGLYPLDALLANPLAFGYSCSVFAEDYDLDDDGLPNDREICHLFAGDALSSDFAVQDTDGDTITDDQDNCPAMANPEQIDFDNDGIGDLCDPDRDNDGLENGLENAIGSNPYNQDSNGDGTPDGQAWETNVGLGLAVYMEPPAVRGGDSRIVISGVRSPNAQVTVSVSDGAAAGTVSYPDETSWSCPINGLNAYRQYSVTLTATETGSTDPSGFGSGTITRTAVPVALFSVPEVVVQGENFLLDGSASYVQDGSAPVRYYWTLLDGPGSCGNLAPGVTVSTTEPKYDLAADSPSPAEGVYTFGLTVEDQAGEMSAQVQVSMLIHKPITIFVDQAADTTGQDGSDDHPFVTIQQGVDAAMLGDTVLVRAGTYTGAGNKNILLTGKGITLRSSNGRDRTIIDCENDGRGITIGSGTPARLLIDGFTIRNGNYSWGAGLYIRSANPTIRNCIFSGNQTVTGGGGIGMYGSAPQITNCLFINNTGHKGGGAVHVERSRPLFRACSFTGNLSAKNAQGDYGDGGAIYAHDNSVLTVINSTFTENNAARRGGAVTVSGYAVNLFNCRFTGNHADSSSGGALYLDGGSGNIVNGVFNGNAANQGGALAAGNGAELTISHSTLFANQAAWGGALSLVDSEAAVTDSIFWQSSARIDGQQAVLDNRSLLSIGSTDFEGGIGAILDYSADSSIDYQPTNINSDPLFRDPAGKDQTAGTGDDDLQLQEGSPCIDRGDNATLPTDSYDLDEDGDLAEPVSLDIDGNFRIWPFDGSVDLGASEYADNGLLAEYSNGVRRFEGPVFNGYSRNCPATGNNLYQNVCTPLADSPVNWAWGDFSVQWSGYLYAPVSGTYRFSSHYWVDGTVRVEVNGTTVADIATDGGGYSGQVTLEGGQWVPVNMSFASNGGSNTMVFGWTVPGRSWSLVPRRCLVGSVGGAQEIILPKKHSVLMLALPAFAHKPARQGNP